MSVSPIHTSPLRLQIIDPDSGNVLGPMERGEVLFDMSYRTSGYIGNPEATAAFIDDQGWIHTGNFLSGSFRIVLMWKAVDPDFTRGIFGRFVLQLTLATTTTTGRLFLCGRLNVVINCFDEKNVYPAEIELYLLGHPAVEQVAVLGVRSPDIGDAPAAIVVLMHGYSADEQLAEELKEFVAERLPSYMHLYGGVYFAEQLPTNSLAKVRRSLLPGLLKNLRRMDCANYSIEECEY
ncbi:hypothetical protein HPB48_004065 [Haemaphysalis longicornis]|uniref:AMP-binding enzyme C-terminal domain-containing protein n=1 Tax=Haemaphysalis longicornis TaxID=44386 RepID=A0A9J6FXJ9_HAELO|nr:hypothetical protein HPB48_004065 [Haemaphysalis longicornis]